MELWTVAVVVEGEYRLILNFGGAAYWCTFDFTLRPAPEVCGVVINLAPAADAVAERWFPHLERGMRRELAETRARGRVWSGISIEIRGVKEHPIDTTEKGCERYGAAFIYDLRHDGVYLGTMDEAPPQKHQSGTLVTIATYRFLPAAQVVQLGLEAEGFQAFLLDTATAIGFIKLQVPSNQAEAAVAYIERTHYKAPTTNAIATGPTCLACDATFPDEASQCPACGWSFGEPSEFETL